MDVGVDRGAESRREKDRHLLKGTLGLWIARVPSVACRDSSTGCIARGCVGDRVRAVESTAAVGRSCTAIQSGRHGCQIVGEEGRRSPGLSPGSARVVQGVCGARAEGPKGGFAPPAGHAQINGRPRRKEAARRAPNAFRRRFPRFSNVAPTEGSGDGSERRDGGAAPCSRAGAQCAPGPCRSSISFASMRRTSGSSSTSRSIFRTACSTVEWSRPPK